MSVLQFIQTTPAELAELISEGVQNQLKKFKKDLLTQEANDELLTRKETCELKRIRWLNF